MTKYIIHFILIFNTFVYSQETIGNYFQTLLNNYPEYSKLRNSEYKLFCEKFSLNSESTKNQSQFYNIYFLHDLFTGSSAQNYMSGGILKIPYFWHWVNPNPRHDIKFTKDSTKLSKAKPPHEFLKYKSYADIDRTPSLYLGDLLSDEPKYYHEQCSSFYTFGWCSEREMAFNSLLAIIGFKVKIKQSGIHTWSEIYTKFETQNKDSMVIIFKVDNTFDIIEYKPLKKGMTFEKWQADIGQGAEIKWYNKKSHSRSELEKVKSLIVTEKASKRINKLIQIWLEQR